MSIEEGGAAERRPELALAEEFAAISRLLASQPDFDAVLARNSALAVEHIPGCEHAGISLVEDGRIATHGGTDDVAWLVDRLQYEAGEGPCLDAVGRDQVCETGDLASDGRWPAFAPEAARTTGVRSMISFGLHANRSALGSLNLYSGRTHAFSEGAPGVGSVDVAGWGSVFAAHAAIVLAAARDRANLRAAMDTRGTIGAAIGIIMARQQVGHDQAFEILSRASQRMNVKLRDIAAQITEGGRPPA